MYATLCTRRRPVDHARRCCARCPRAHTLTAGDVPLQRSAAEPPPASRHPRRSGAAGCDSVPFRISEGLFSTPAWPGRARRCHPSCPRIGASPAPSGRKPCVRRGRRRRFGRPHHFIFNEGRTNMATVAQASVLVDGANVNAQTEGKQVAVIGRLASDEQVGDTRCIKTEAHSSSLISSVYPNAIWTAARLQR